MGRLHITISLNAFRTLGRNTDIVKNCKPIQSNKTYLCSFSENTVKLFKSLLSKGNWNYFTEMRECTKNKNELYKNFLRIFKDNFNVAFPLRPM